MTRFGERVKSRREQLGLTQEQLAERLGYKSRSSINKIEMGKNDIPQSKLPDFAKALNTTVAYLIGLTDNSTPHTTLIGAVADDNGLLRASAFIKESEEAITRKKGD